jgi:hypothetical protein
MDDRLGRHCHPSSPWRTGPPPGKGPRDACGQGGVSASKAPGVALGAEQMTKFPAAHESPLVNAAALRQITHLPVGRTRQAAIQPPRHVGMNRQVEPPHFTPSKYARQDILNRLPCLHDQRPRGSRAMIDAAGARARLREVRPGAWLISPYTGWKWAKWPSGDVGWLPSDVELPPSQRVPARNDIQ